MEFGRTGTTVALEGWERRSMVLMPLVRPMMLATLKADSLHGRTSKALTLNCKLAINSFATQ